MQKIILHIDFDSYFASCEQQFSPSLRGKPIGVTAANGRTAIIAASREAKKRGVKSPGRTFEAQQIVPEIIFVSAHFEKYWEITQKFLNICKDFSPYVELFSLDEVFIDISPTLHLFKDKFEIINKIKERIKNEIGEYITVSVGISYNKLLSKLASGINKPNGLLEITPRNLQEVYQNAKLNDFCGIGRRIEVRLKRMGIATPLDLRQTSLSILIKEFKNVEGHFLYDLGQGIDKREVVPYYLAAETKSVGRSYCLPQNTYDQRLILQNIYELCEEISLKLRRLSKKGRTVSLYLGGEHSNHGRKTVINHIDKGNDIFNLCKLLYDEWKPSMVRQIAISIGNLADAKNLTLSLFDEEARKNKVSGVIDKINEKFGDHTIRNGFIFNGPNLKTVPNGFMADKYERARLVEN